MTEYKPEGNLIDTVANKNSFKSLSALKEAFDSDKILEARTLICDNEHNLHVDLGCIKGIIPRVEGAIGIVEGTVRDIAIISRVNKPVCFKITGFKRDINDKVIATLSRAQAQRECMENYISKLKPGDVINAKVTHLEPFGSFVDIGCGISSLIPIDAISISRISHPSDRFSTGQDIRAIVKVVDENGRITLTHKELLGTWEENVSMFLAGETVGGIIRSVEEYGIFIELTPNLAGLAEFCDNVRPGEHASVYIKSLIPERMKIKLIIVDSFEAQYVNKKQNYFFKEDHMSHFVYSPENCDKVIETVFDT